jgi:4,5-dihydroxyphthalate decarboxylase
VFDDTALDVVEMSIARYARLCSEDRTRLVAAPYYFSRSFPHKYFYVRSDFAGDTPAAMRGLRVGLSEFDHTGHTWARVLMQDEYGVAPADVQWVCARREVDRPALKQDFTPPEGVTLAYSAPDKTLSRMLLVGEIDVMINPNIPTCFTESPDRVRRLFRDPAQAELAYYRNTGICPILHVLGVRRDLALKHPWLGAALVDALKAEVGATRKLWQVDAADDTPSVALSGLETNERSSLETFLRHHHNQGMSSERLTLERFFGGRS